MAQFKFNAPKEQIGKLITRVVEAMKEKCHVQFNKNMSQEQLEQRFICIIETNSSNGCLLKLSLEWLHSPILQNNLNLPHLRIITQQSLQKPSKFCHGILLQFNKNSQEIQRTDEVHNHLKRVTSSSFRKIGVRDSA